MATPPFDRFAAEVAVLRPRVAVVLGSGLGGASAAFREAASVGFGDVPGLVPPTVSGHTGRLAVGDWAGVPVLLVSGRLHFYEGHSWDVVTGTVRVAADLGAKVLILTNAAGGIHHSLAPGSLMAIRGHITFVGPGDWRRMIATAPVRPYSDRLTDEVVTHQVHAGHEILNGMYAAVTGPCYETPAEIRAFGGGGGIFDLFDELRRDRRVFSPPPGCGAHAVGMSTAKEAEAAAALGLEVAAISCITNRAAGLSDGPLDHREVLDNARLAVDRLAELLGHLVRVA